MKTWLDNLIKLVFPPRCEVCRADSHAALCPACAGQVKFMKPHLGIYSVAVYEGVMRQALHRFKFKRRKRISHALGVMLINYLSRAPGLNLKEIDMIVPVPLPAGRLKARGFNQSRLVAEVLTQYFGIPVGEVLIRLRETRPQFDLPRGERFKNVYGAFRVSDPSVVRNKRILLLDDIYTTGATIFESTRALKNAGAARVEIVTLSRAVEQNA